MAWQAADFHELVSGRRRGFVASCARGALGLAAGPYRWGMAWRNRSYDRGRYRVDRVEVPVISVGNLTLGGTGKTPLVAHLARWYREQGVRVALVSRGYGAAPGQANDEALELEDLLPDVPHVQDRDRVAMARLAVEEFASQLLILDDGFQHRRLHRDLDIVLLDALCPWGHGRVFPRGLLRESPVGLRRAQVVALSRADHVDAAERDQVRDQARALAPHADWIELAHRPRALRNCHGTLASLDLARAQPIAAFCGLGNPAGFRHTLDELAGQVRGFREFPDHHRYARDDVAELARWVADSQAELVLTSHKDLVKLGVEQLAGRPLWAIEIAIEVLTGQPALAARLQALLPPAADG